MRVRSKLAIHDATPQLKTNQFTSISIHLTPANVRHDTMNGRPHLVAPCVMMTEGVHEGSEGPLLYPEDELAANTSLWNMKPVVVYHPVANGSPVSACDPFVIDKYGVGVLMNTRWEKDGLRTECWIEEERVGLVDNRVLEALNSGQVMEVSTGLFLDVESGEGEWNEEQYKGIARNHRPDHLAILPDLKGACSVEDGAGLLRNTSEGDGPKSLLAAYHLGIVNELSANDLWNKINDLLRGSEGTDAWVIDIWDGFFVYEDGKGGTWYQKYMVQDDEVRFEGIRTAAEKETRYKLADGSYVGNTQTNHVEDSTMTEKERKQLVDKLIAHAKSPFKEEDREELLKMDDGRLQWTANVQSEETPPDPKPEPKPEPKPAAETPTEPTEPKDNAQEPKEPTVDEYIANAPKGIQDVLRSGVASHGEEKRKLVEKIKANERNPFSQEQLESKSLEELKGLAQLAEVPAPAPSPAPTAHFSGMAPVTPAEGSQEEEPLVVPAINFGDKD